MSSMCDKIVCLGNRHELEDKKLKLFSTLAEVSTVDFENASGREQALDQHQALSFLLAWATANAEAGQVSNVEEVTSNIEHFTGKVAAYEQALQKIANMVNDMRQLAVLSMDESKTDEDRLNYDSQYQALADGLSKISGSAQYNGQPVMNLSGATWTALQNKYKIYYSNLNELNTMQYQLEDDKVAGGGTFSGTTAASHRYPKDTTPYYMEIDNKELLGNTDTALNSNGIEISSVGAITASAASTPTVAGAEAFVNTNITNLKTAVAGDITEVNTAAVANKNSMEVCQKVKARLMAATGLQDQNSRYTAVTSVSGGQKASDIPDVNTVFQFCFEPINDVSLGMQKFDPSVSNDMSGETATWRGTVIRTYNTARVQANQAGNALRDVRERINSAKSAQKELQMIKESNIKQYHNLINVLERQREFAKNQINRELCNILKTISYLNACIRHNGD